MNHLKVQIQLNPSRIHVQQREIYLSNTRKSSLVYHVEITRVYYPPDEIDGIFVLFTGKEILQLYAKFYFHVLLMKFFLYLCPIPEAE